MQSISQGAASRASCGYAGSAEELNSSHRRDAHPEEQTQYFAAHEQGQEQWDQTKITAEERRATRNVVQMGGNLPTHSYLVFY